MTIKLYKSKETCFPNINTKGTHFFISVFDTLKEKKCQHISDNIPEIINKIVKKSDIPFKCCALSIFLNQIQLSVANNNYTFGKLC